MYYNVAQYKEIVIVAQCIYYDYRYRKGKL
jgi:hypothetical protein